MLHICSFPWEPHETSGVLVSFPWEPMLWCTNEIWLLLLSSSLARLIQENRIFCIWWWPFNFYLVFCRWATRNKRQSREVQTPAGGGTAGNRSCHPSTMFHLKMKLPVPSTSSYGSSLTLGFGDIIRWPLDVPRALVASSSKEGSACRLR